MLSLTESSILRDLADRLDSSAAISARPGQMLALEDIAGTLREIAERNRSAGEQVSRDELEQFVGDLSNRNPFPEAADITDGLLSEFSITRRKP